MTSTERLLGEQAFHDDQARHRAATFRVRPGELHVDDDAYLDHETWVRPAFGRLGDLHGLHVLDYGCGHGMAAVVLARRGALVTACDLSPGYLTEARRRARANGVAINFAQADGAQLPFADASFDRIWGNAVLHHLDIEAAARELWRVLRPDGFAVFCEPWGGNPLLDWARRHVDYPAKGRTPDEEPLRPRHLRLLRKVFPDVHVQGFQLLSMVRRVLGTGRIVAGLDWSDRLLLHKVPALQRFCRYVVLTLKRG